MCFVEYAHHLYDNGDDEQAVKFYNKSINLNSNYYAYGGIAAILLKRKQFKEALNYCKQADSVKANILIDIMLYIIYNAMGEINSAKIMFEKILKYFKNNQAAAYDRVAYSYFQLSMFHEAEYYSKQALQILPKEAGIHYNLAQIYLAQEKLSDAKKELQEVLGFASNKRYKKYAADKLKNLNKRLQHA